MFFSAALVALVAPLFASAAPIPRAASATDALVFQFADVLEQLETQFYQQAVQKFQASDWANAGFANGNLPVQLITGIQSDEATHQSFLASSLPDVGSSAPTGCSFNFGNALNDPNTFAATARLIEYVGVSAYLGGAALVDDPQLLDAAASILTVEARHQTVLNILSKTGTSVPQAFDIALTPNEVLALAGPLISGCSLSGLTPNTPLTVTNTNVQPGNQLNFQSSALNSSVDTSNFSCQLITGGIPFADVLPFDQCVIPSGVNGPIAVWITSDAQPLTNNVVTRATNKQVAGPAIIFVDDQPEMIGMLVAGGNISNNSGNSNSNSGSSSNGSNSNSNSGSSSNGSNSNSNSGSSSNGSNGNSGSGTNTAAASITTTTISPAQAQAIIASISASSAAAQSTGGSGSTTSNAPLTGQVGAGFINPVAEVSASSLSNLPGSEPSSQRNSNNAASGPAPAGSSSASASSTSTSSAASSSQSS